MSKLVIMTQKQLDALVQKKVEERAAYNNRQYELDLLMKQANIAMLQSQINPHFLYNALECIRGQALKEKSVDIANITQALSRFFRYSISGKQDKVTLGDELRNAENYILIQQYRFKNRFSFEIIAGETGAVNDAVVPKLSVQPLLENAIIHGLKDKTSEGRIVLKVQLSCGNISITVSDNGAGMDAAQLAKLSSRLHNSTKLANSAMEGSSHSIGLMNVDRRLKLMFGQEFGLSVNSTHEFGTSVEMFLPYTTMEEHQ